MGGGGMGGPGGPEQMDIDLEDLLGGIGGNRGGFKFSPNSGQKPRKQSKVQDDTIEREIFVSIEEIATGCEKKMKISRKVFREDGSKTVEDKVLKIVVKPGWKAGTKVTFAKEGDQVPGKIPADIAFIIKDKPHPLFSRDGVNLKYNYKIPLRESLCGTVVQSRLWREKRWESIAQGRCSSPPQPRGCRATACPSQKTQPRGAISLSALMCSSPTSSPRVPRTSSMTCSLKPLAI